MSQFTRNLRERLMHETDPKIRIDIQNQLVFEMRDGDDNDAISKSREIIDIAGSLPDGPYHVGIANAKQNIAMRLMISGRSEEGIRYFNEAEAIHIEQQYHPGIAFSKVMKANYHWMRGEVNPAMDLIYEGIQTIEQVPDPLSKGWVHFFLGTFYGDMHELENSLEHLNRSREYFSEIGHDDGLGRCHNSLTLTFRKKGDQESAITHARASLEIYRSTNNHMGVARSLTDVGSLLADMGKFEEATSYLKESLTLRRESSHMQGITTTLIELGLAARNAGQIEEARNHLREAHEVAQKIEAKGKLVRIHKLLYEIAKEKKEESLALLHLEAAYRLDSEMLKQDAESRIRSVEYRMRAEAIGKEAEIERLKSVELRKAYDQIEEQTRDITDSLRYAKTIQDAILPGPEIFGGCFDDFFVFYSPRGIVSGDFYWARKKENIIQAAVVDCTGHGVPGALMSMLGFSILNQVADTVNVTEPGLVLDRLREEIVEGLKQQGVSGSRDGMDLGFISLDCEQRKIWFAGANRPLLVIEPSTGDTREVRGDKFPAGVHPSYSSHDFTHHCIPYNKGEILYLFSDGFPDQFGGPGGKKYKFRRFRDLLQSIVNEPMDVQRNKLSEEFFSWKGELEQVDDVTVLGIRLP